MFRSVCRLSPCQSYHENLKVLMCHHYQNPGSAYVLDVQCNMCITLSHNLLFNACEQAPCQSRSTIHPACLHTYTHRPMDEGGHDIATAPDQIVFNDSDNNENALLKEAGSTENIEDTSADENDRCASPKLTLFCRYRSV